MRRFVPAVLVLAACGLDVVGASTTGTDGGPGPGITPSGPSPTDAAVPVADGSVAPPVVAAPGDVLLTVTVTGSGMVTSDDVRIACPPDCSASVAKGKTVRLRAKYGAGAALRDWTGGCVGREPTCTMTLEAAATATATFTPVTHYMHTEHALYTVASADGATKKVDDFKGDCNGGMVVADLAIDRNGKAYVTSWSNNDLFTLDLASATCTKIGNLGRQCNGLGIAPDPKAPQNDALFASCGKNLYRVNSTTGAASVIGGADAFGSGNDSSGDISYVPGSGMYVAIIPKGADVDRLARVSLTEGTLTIAGPMSQKDVWGLGTRDGKILAYRNDRILLVDPTNGSSSNLNESTGLPVAGGASWP